MWIKKTDVEIRRSKKQRRVREIANAILLWAGLSIITAAVPGWGEWSVTVATFNDFLNRLPAKMFWFSAVAAFYFWPPFGKGKNAANSTTLICPDCEKVKAADGNLVCPCGGRFVDIDEMKWIDK